MVDLVRNSVSCCYLRFVISTPCKEGRNMSELYGINAGLMRQLCVNYWPNNRQ